VLYIAAEGGAGFPKRVEAWRQRYGGEDAEFYLMTVRPSLIHDHGRLIADIKTQLGGKAPAAIVVDTLNRTMAGSEGKDVDMAMYLRACSIIEDAFACAVALVHHCGLEKGRPRGHTSLPAAVEAQIAIVRDAAHNVVATLELAKDLESGADIVSGLDRVELGKDLDGDPVHTLVIVAVEGGAAKLPPRLKLSKGQRLALGALNEVILSKGRPAPAEYELPQGIKVVTSDEWKVELGRQQLLEGENPRARYRELRNALRTKLLIGVRDEFLWIAQR